MTPQWVKGAVLGVYTEMRDDGPWTLIDDDAPKDDEAVEPVSFEPVFDEPEPEGDVPEDLPERVTPSEDPPRAEVIESMITVQLDGIDSQIAQLVAERETVNGEIRRLRAERIPIARLANAAKPRKPRRPRAVPDA